MTIQLADRPIVVIEDSDEDFEATVWALRRARVANPVHRCANAGHLAELWAGRPNWPTALAGAYPILVMLDLNISGSDWHETLDRLRSNPWWRPVPVVVVSTSKHPATVSACYSAGAGGYVRKSIDLGVFGSTIESVARFWLQTVVPPPPLDHEVL